MGVFRRKPVLCNRLFLPEVSGSDFQKYGHVFFDNVFDDFRRLHIPGFIVADIPHDPTVARSELLPILERLGCTLNAKPIDILIRNGHGDGPLHIDGVPKVSKGRADMIVHHTSEGEADVLLASPAKPFVKILAKGHYPPMPEGTEALLDEQGKVDPRVLEQNVYIGRICAGSVVIFAQGGPKPTAHRFTTLTPTRTSVGWIGDYVLAA